MGEYSIELKGETREDGSVHLTSPDLPLFCVTGESARAALDLAMRLLPSYLKFNVPEFVDLRPIPSATELLSSKGAAVLPAHVIARTTKGRVNAAEDHSG